MCQKTCTHWKPLFQPLTIFEGKCSFWIYSRWYTKKLLKIRFTKSKVFNWSCRHFTARELPRISYYKDELKVYYYMCKVKFEGKACKMGSVVGKISSLHLLYATTKAFQRVQYRFECKITPTFFMYSASRQPYVLGNMQMQAILFTESWA